MESLLSFLAPDNFMPHGHRYLWTPELLWLYVISIGTIALSYFSIPIAIIYFIRKRIDLAFNCVFMMFSLFIFACGTTHLISILTIWQPAYWLDASMKGFTAVASAITAVMLWRLMLVALTVTSKNSYKLELLEYLVKRVITKPMSADAFAKLLAADNVYKI